MLDIQKEDLLMQGSNLQPPDGIFPVLFPEGREIFLEFGDNSQTRCRLRQ
jgi:hypothetical protein